MHKDKRGVSTMIGYVLLIVIAIALALLVFAWLSSYTPIEELDCQDGTSIIVEEVSCSGGIVTYTIKNKGTFTIDGVQIRAGEEGRITREILNSNGIEIEGDYNDNDLLEPGENATHSYVYIGFRNNEFEVQAIQDEGEGPRLCTNAIAIQSFKCDTCFNGMLESWEVIDQTISGFEHGGFNCAATVGPPPLDNTLDVAVTTPGDYVVKAVIDRGSGLGGVCPQEFENFELIIDGQYSDESIDPNYDYDGVTCTDVNNTEDLGVFTFTNNPTTLILNSTAPSCPTTPLTSNSIHIVELCIHEP